MVLLLRGLDSGAASAPGRRCETSGGPITTHHSHGVFVFEGDVLETNLLDGDLLKSKLETLIT